MASTGTPSNTEHGGRAQSNGTERDRLLTMARLAEQSERFDDMILFMRQLIEKFHELTSEEQNMFSISYKNVIGAKRSAWRVMSSYASRFVPSEDLRTNVAKQYMKRIQEELDKVCTEVLHLLDSYLIPNVHIPDTKVFYLKMKGDYYRYLAEVNINFEDDGRKKVVQLSNDSYEQALKLAEQKMVPTNPIRLGLALNYSVFFYEILNSTEKACQLAKAAFDEAITQLDRISGECYKDSTLIMQLLRDNLTLWSPDTPNEGGVAGAYDYDQQNPDEPLDHQLYADGAGDNFHSPAHLDDDNEDDADVDCGPQGGFGDGGVVPDLTPNGRHKPPPPNDVAASPVNIGTEQLSAKPSDHSTGASAGTANSGSAVNSPRTLMLKVH